MALKITLEKSLIGRLEKQQKTAASLGLKKIGDVTVQEDNAATKGKIEVIKHMVRVENA
ncbi:MAG: 50S ribosomal protein L30 [Clostridia bacterium]|nr:50S ribosomal protein L30 [Clostridia bacterium]